MKGENSLIIRELKSEDLEKYSLAVKELLIETYINNFRIQDKQAEELCEDKLSLLAGYISTGSAIVIAAIEMDELIGFTWLYKHYFFGEKRLHVNQIAVNTRYRGKGIGKKLIQEAENQAIREGIKTIDLFVSEVNQSALNLYDKLGFNTERRYMKKEL